jgi:hypothetical protein
MKGGPQRPVLSGAAKPRYLVNSSCSFWYIEFVLKHPSSLKSRMWHVQGQYSGIPSPSLCLCPLSSWTSQLLHIALSPVVSIAENDSKRYKGKGFIYTSLFVRKGLYMYLDQRYGRKMHCMSYLFSNIKRSLVYVESPWDHTPATMIIWYLSYKIAFALVSSIHQLNQPTHKQSQIMIFWEPLSDD